MASMRDIKRRIKSVSNTQQITKAMNLVAASKLQKAKNQLALTRPYYTEIRKVVASVMNSTKGVNHPYVVKKQGDKAVVITIAADRGLCGGYNVNVSKQAYNFIKDREDVSLITVGSKSRDYFNRRGANIVESLIGVSEEPSYETARVIGDKVLEMYNSGEVDEIYLNYTEFVSTITHEPKLIKILPVDPLEFKNDDENEDNKNGTNLMDFEPSDEEVLNSIVPKYVKILIYGALLESSTCEQGARMTSMDAATENAVEVMDTLTLKYNRARQVAITQEITEIVGGASALN